MPGMTGRPGAVPRSAPRTAVLLAAVALVLLGPGTTAALAHDELVGTVPAAGTTARTAPGGVELQLGGAAQALGTQVVVTASDGRVVSQGSPQLRGSTVRQPLTADLGAGDYTVAWKVTSGDGHSLTGTFAFTVAAGADGGGADPASAAPAPGPPGPRGAAPGEAAPSEAAAARPVESSAGDGWLVAGAAAAVAAVGAVLLRLRRRA